MTYYQEEKEEVIKYDVTLNKEKLTRLRDEVINNCSKVVHREYESDIEPDFFDVKRYRNYRAKKTGRVKEYYGEDKNIYELQYDEYIYPKLVNYIDMLLRGDFNIAYQSLKVYKGENQEEPIESNGFIEIKTSIEHELTKDEINITKLKELLNKVEEYQNNLKLNKKRKSDMNYYQEVMSCITLTEIDRITKNEVKRVENFYGRSYIKKK